MELCDHLSIASPSTGLDSVTTIDSTMDSVSFEPFSPYDQRSRLDTSAYTVAPLLWSCDHCDYSKKSFACMCRIVGSTSKAHASLSSRI